MSTVGNIYVKLVNIQNFKVHEKTAINYYLKYNILASFHFHYVSDKGIYITCI